VTRTLPPPPSPKPLTKLPKRSAKTWSLWKSGEDPFAECLMQRSNRKFEENQGALRKADEEALRAAAAAAKSTTPTQPYSQRDRQGKKTTEWSRPCS